MSHTVRDSRGTQIVPGQTVAYNRSGDVIEGEVLKVSSGSVLIMAHPDFLLHRGAGTPSRVRNRLSILVLR